MVARKLLTGMAVWMGVDEHKGFGFCSVGVSDPPVKSSWLWSIDPIPDVLDAVE